MLQADVAIRAAQEEDLPAILELLAQPAMDGCQVVGVDEAREIFAAIRGVPDYGLFVAESGDGVVGTFALLIMPNLGHRGSPSGVLEDIVVAEGRHAQGIGRRMVAHALDLCRARGCYKLVLSSNLRRREAHAFYEHLGFERHGFSYRVRL